MGWLTLSERRKFKRLIVMRNCLEGRAPQELCRVLTVNSDIRGDNGVITRGHDDIHLCHAKTEFGRSRFGFAGGKEWNLLPADLKRMRFSAGFNSDSVLKCYFISTCLCDMYNVIYHLYFNVLIIISLFCMSSTHNCYPLLYHYCCCIIFCNYLCMY